MRRRGFLKLAGLASLGALIPSWAVRAWDWLTYRPLTNDEITEMVAHAVRNTSYHNWAKNLGGPPVVGRLRHSFTELQPGERQLTAEEFDRAVGLLRRDNVRS